MKQQPTTFSLTQAAELIQVRGGTKELIDWLHLNQYLTDELIPTKSAKQSRLIFCQRTSLSNNQVGTQLYITLKGLCFFGKKINHSNYTARTHNWNP